MHQKLTSVPRGHGVAIMLEPHEVMAKLRNAFAALVDDSGSDEALTPPSCQKRCLGETSGPVARERVLLTSGFSALAIGRVSVCERCALGLSGENGGA